MRENSQCICLSVILINSVCRTGENYNLQAFVEEYEYAVKGKKMPGYITDDVEISSDSDIEDSDAENSHEENSDEKN